MNKNYRSKRNYDNSNEMEIINKLSGYILKQGEWDKDDRRAFFLKVEEYSRYYLNNDSSSQIRNIYNIINTNRLSLDNLMDLDYQIHYLAGRNIGTKRFENFLKHLLSHVLRKVENDEQLNKLKLFAKALISYHKFYAKN